MVFAETEDHKETDTCCHAHTGLSAIVRSSRFHPPVKKADDGGRGVAFGVPAPARICRHRPRIPQNGWCNAGTLMSSGNWFRPRAVARVSLPSMLISRSGIRLEWASAPAQAPIILAHLRRLNEAPCEQGIMLSPFVTKTSLCPRAN